ncbi:MAG: hypothetical protein EAY75_08075 [Bacteroidetes bacterium]|nr:MAG: hypothetical protein EAY75_08075 [Bacteroidota bacterium]
MRWSKYGVSQFTHWPWLQRTAKCSFFGPAGCTLTTHAAAHYKRSKKALLPAAAALGGMLVPAALFLAFNAGTPFQSGWGIPMATDIAFSLGAASLLGKRFPMALRIFLTALAIIDDLGAIVVIALFYGHAISFWYLLVAGGCMVLLLLLNKWVKRFGIGHVLVGLVLWYAIFCSGVHATVAGVLLALTVPVAQISGLERRC